MHSANIMQCISGPMECIKLHSISIRLRVPGLRACVRDPARRPLSPRAARVRRPERLPLHQIKRGIGEGGGKTPGGFQSYVYIISHPHVTPTPKGPYKTGGPLLKAASVKFQKSGKKTVLCWSCLSTADGQILLYTPFPLVLPGARNTRQARRAQHRGTAWASNRTSEQRQARL